MADRAATARSIRRAVDVVSRGERRNVRQILRSIEDIRRTMLARLVTGGTEFSAAMQREMVRETEAAMARLSQELSAAFREQFAAAAQSGSGEALRQLGIALPEQAPGLVGLDLNVLDFAAQETDNLVRGLTEDTRAQLVRTINSGAIGTQTPAEVAAKIGTVLSRAGRPEGVFGRLATQVERIHRTETATVFSLSSLATSRQAAQQVGRVAKKRWITVVDGRTRPDHRMLNGATIPLEEHFNVGAGPKWSKVSWERAKRESGVVGEKAMAPLDPALTRRQRINCRCAPSMVFGKRLDVSPEVLLGLRTIAQWEADARLA